MANTVVADLGSAGTTAYDLYVYASLRSEVAFSSPMIRKVKSTSQTHQGSTVKFWFRPDLSAVTTPLTENADVTPRNISDTSIDVSITEYGDVIGKTLKAEGTDMIGLDADMARLNGNVAADSYELLARAGLANGIAAAQTIRPGGKAQNALLAADTLTAADVRKAVAYMRRDSVGSFGGKYMALVAPETSLDLREQTGDTAWVTSRNYSDITGINNGEIGTFGGAIFYETPRVATLANAGNANVDVYQNWIIGQEALAMAYSRRVSAEAPQARISPVTDKLSRFHGVGWYWLGGFNRFRPEASYLIETASSIGDNA